MALSSICFMQDKADAWLKPWHKNAGDNTVTAQLNSTTALEIVSSQIKAPHILHPLPKNARHQMDKRPSHSKYGYSSVRRKNSPNQDIKHKVSRTLAVALYKLLHVLLHKIHQMNAQLGDHIQCSFWRYKHPGDIVSQIYNRGCQTNLTFVLTNQTQSPFQGKQKVYSSTFSTQLTVK
jgi:hypothetical protein